VRYGSACAGGSENSPPSCHINTFLTSCNTATLDDTHVSDPDGDALSFSWSSPDVTISPSSGSIPAGAGDRLLPLSTATLTGSPNLCGAGETRTLTLTVSDGNGGVSTCPTNVTFRDMNAPELSGVPADTTVECNAVPAAPIVTALDDCDSSVTPVLSETTTPGSCLNSYTLTRTWTATDDCNNTESRSQIITVRDTTDPMFVDLPVDQTAGYAELPDAMTDFLGQFVTASDNCGTAVISSELSELDPDPSCALTGTMTGTWTATDACGRTTAITRTLTIIDTTPPVITCSVSRFSRVLGDEIPGVWPPNHRLYDVGLVATVTDACDTAAAVTSVVVYCDEDDETPTGDGTHSPDARDHGVGTLRLRAERMGDSDGRVYLIVVGATDASGNVGYHCCTVVVPHSLSSDSVQHVLAQAVAARDACMLRGDGGPPAGFVPCGEAGAPVIGPNQ
jgi:hypothetical protein